MIILTGDIHHSSLRTGAQQHCDTTEVRVSQQYLQLVEEAGVKVTLYVSGKTFVEEWADIEPICRSPSVEIGGHNYSCLTPTLWHRIWKKLIGSYNGPAWYQRRDALKTIEVIRARTGKTIRCWRNHQYWHGPFTETVLSECGIRLCADGVSRDAMGPILHETGMYNFPLNVIPDHEHIYHAERTPEWVAAWQARYDWSDDFGPDSYPIEEWTEIVLDGLRRNEERGAISHLLIHPLTMYLCDGFVSFRRILDYLATRETVFVAELLERLDRPAGSPA